MIHLGFSLSEEDFATLVEIMQAGGFATPTSAIRCALWKLGKHLDLKMPPTAFEQRKDPAPTIKRRVG
jgi:hypothetical protein